MYTYSDLLKLEDAVLLMLNKEVISFFGMHSHSVYHACERPRAKGAKGNSLLWDCVGLLIAAAGEQLQLAWSGVPQHGMSRVSPAVLCEERPWFLPCICLC